MVDLDATRRQVALVQAAHAKAAETANRNYAVAKDLEQKLSTAKGGDLARTSRSARAATCTRGAHTRSCAA